MRAPVCVLGEVEDERQETELNRLHRRCQFLQDPDSDDFDCNRMADINCLGSPSYCLNPYCSDVINANVKNECFYRL